MPQIMFRLEVSYHVELCNIMQRSLKKRRYGICHAIAIFGRPVIPAVFAPVKD